jgi:hypothetical protein
MPVFRNSDKAANRKATAKIMTLGRSYTYLNNLTFGVNANDLAGPTVKGYLCQNTL